MVATAPSPSRRRTRRPVASDDAGNQTLDGDAAYVYDAWNRLVRVEVGEEFRAAYSYYPLHQRATRKANLDYSDDPEPTVGLVDERNLYYYDASWRLLEEHVILPDGPQDPEAADDWSDLARIVQRVWGLSYIDELVAVLTDSSAEPDGDMSSASRLYAVRDRRHDVVALMGANGDLAERVRYTAYGVARHIPFGDINGDGKVNGTDLGLLQLAYNTSIGDQAYDVDADLNLDGEITTGVELGLLLNAWDSTGLPEGRVSKVGNTVGYAGYLYDPAVDLYSVRSLCCDAKRGR